MASGLHLQARDLSALALLGELGIADTDMLHERCFPGVTRRRCQQRIRLWADHGLTRTVHLSVWFTEERGGRVPSVHCLTDRGAEAVAAAYGQRPRRIPKLDAKPETFYHRLAVVRVRLAIDDAFRVAALDPPTWIFEHDRRCDARAHEPLPQQRVLYHVFAVGGSNVTCQPDAATWMKIPRGVTGAAEGYSDLLGYWEIDRSTESRTQIARKLPGYAALAAQQGFCRYWPQLQRPTVRVFWVCQSEQRIASLRERLQGEPIAEIFRFTTATELAAGAALTVPIWQSLDGSRRAIVRAAPGHS